MGFLDFLKKKDAQAPLSNLSLEDLQLGYLFDYEMLTWQVVAMHKYTYGGGYSACEWEIMHGDQRKFLMRSAGDEIAWCLGEKIVLREITPDVVASIVAKDDPPASITWQGTKYHLDESGTGLFYRDQKEEETEFVYWEMIDEGDEAVITIEQWGERDFTASHAKWVEVYQFSNILPHDLPQGDSARV